MTFTMTVQHKVKIEEAMAAADEIERAVGEICNGKRKAGSIPMQELCSVVQFVRESAQRIGASEIHNLLSDAQNRRTSIENVEDVLSIIESLR